MTNEDYILMWLDGLTIKEHAEKFGVPQGAEIEFYYQRFLDITTTEVMRILRTHALYRLELEDEEKELLKACEYAQDKIDEIRKNHESEE